MTNSESDICRQLRHVLKQSQDSQSMDKLDRRMVGQKDQVETTPDYNNGRKCSCHEDMMETVKNIANKYNIPFPRQAYK